MRDSLRPAGRMLTLATLAIAVVATQWPFDYVVTRFALARRWERIDWAWLHYTANGSVRFDRDFALNLLMLVPLGLGFGLWRQAGRVRIVIEALAFGLATSIALELAQLLTRNRYTSWPDVWHNALGCAVGAMVALWFQTTLDTGRVQRAMR